MLCKRLRLLNEKFDKQTIWKFAKFFRTTISTKHPGIIERLSNAILNYLGLTPYSARGQ
jgi:hypothetical protein